MTIQRAYGVVTIKSADEDAREITGIATTIGTDRDGDIIEPAGAEFRLPIPLLWQHDRSQPIGQVVAARHTRAGIEIRAKLAIPTADMPSQMQARLNEAWASIKSGLVRGLSIGFQALEFAFMDAGGVHVTKWNWHELSAVTVPSNEDATITTIKSLDKPPGAESPGAQPHTPTTGTTEAPAAGGFFYARKGSENMNVAEQIAKLEEKRKALVQERIGIQTKAADEGRTKSAEEGSRFAAITEEVNAIDAEIADLRVMEKDLAATAVPAVGTSTKAAVASRAPVHSATAAAPAGAVLAVGHRPQISVNHNYAEKGLAMSQWVRLQYQSKGNPLWAAQLAESQQGSLDPRVLNMAKAAVPGANTMNPSWAGAMISQTGVFFDFVEFLQPQALIGKFGTGNIPALHPAVFNTPSLIQTTGGAGYWVGEGKARPLTNFGYNNSTLPALTVANIAVITKKLLERATVKADTMLRDQLVAALVSRMDADFIDPAKAAVTGISPASITNGVTAIVSSGTDAEAVRSDVQKLMAKFLAAKNPPTNGVFIMGGLTALALSMMVNALGAREFPEMTMKGGMFFGLPALVSDHVPAGVVALVNASDVYFADEGGFSVDQSDQASLEMSDAPTHNSTTPTGSTSMVSMWQTQSVAFLAQRELNWAKRRDSAVQLLTGVAWGQPAP